MKTASGNSANTRIQWLHKKIANNYYPNAMRLAERFGISHRQAQRDVDFLLRKLSAPLAYNAEHKGYYYTEPFTLPVVITSDNDDSYSVALPGQDELDLFGADSGIIQLQLPYTATVEMENKLTAIELSKFITARRGDKRYICEFHHIEQFLAILITADAGVRIVEPDWLRERLVDMAKGILAANEPVSGTPKKIK